MLIADGSYTELDPNTPANLETEDNPEELTLTQFNEILLEIRDQPQWRTQADREYDFRQGNQLDSALLAKMQELGIPPAVENRIGFIIDSAMGAEAKRRTDWRVIPDGDNSGQDIADALNWKLNQAERRSRADRACSDAYESQYGIGLGWIEVTRSQNPFDYPYRCNVVHRNELFWDWSGYLKSPMGTEARYLVRKKWQDKDLAKLSFPEHKELLEATCTGWSNFDMTTLDGGQSTGLYTAQNAERGWTIEEQEWRDVTRRKIMLFEVWYRRWQHVLVLKSPDGRVVEFDSENDKHIMALMAGMQPQAAVVSKVRRAWFAGPHKLVDEPSPYLHTHFGYVPFWGYREDRTGAPFGRIRDMMYTQENINASLSKIRWGLASVRTIRTDGAYVGTNSQMRNEVSRVNADIVLDAAHMAQPGARFEVQRDFDLSEQQYKMQQDAREALTTLGGVSNEFLGATNKTTSALQSSQMIEQVNQGLANIDDNFKESRAQVGELLLSMIIQDTIGKQETVNIDGGALRDDRSIALNQPTVDPVTGMQELTNDVSRITLKVTLEDTPETTSFKNQQLAALSEAYKATTPEYQRILMPFLMNLLPIANKKEIITAMKEQDAQPSAQQIEQQNKQKELEIKLMLAEAQVKLVEAQKVKVLVESEYSAMQGGAQVASMPAIAPIADVLMQNAGYVTPTPQGIDPDFPQPQPQPAAQVTPQAQQQAAQATPVQGNTSPGLPPVPQQPEGPQSGIETQRTEDNF